MFDRTASQPVLVDIRGLDLRLVVRALVAARLTRELPPSRPAAWSDGDLTGAIDRFLRTVGYIDGNDALSDSRFYSFNDLSITVVADAGGQATHLDVREYDERHVRGEGIAELVIAHVRKHGNCDTSAFASYPPEPPRVEDDPRGGSRPIAGTIGVVLLTAGGAFATADELFVLLMFKQTGVVLVALGLAAAGVGRLLRGRA